MELKFNVFFLWLVFGFGAQNFGVSRVSPVNQLNMSVLWHFVLSPHSRPLEAKLDKDSYVLTAILLMKITIHVNQTHKFYNKLMVHCANAL